MLLRFPTADDRVKFMRHLRQEQPDLIKCVADSFAQPTVVVVTSQDIRVITRVRQAARGRAKVYEDIQFETMI